MWQRQHVNEGGRERERERESREGGSREEEEGRLPRPLYGP